MLVISDASPIIALAVCGKLDLLDKLFDNVCIPQAVFNELTIPNKPKAREIIEWTKNKVMPAKNRTVISALSLNLDRGESEAISLYWETNADFLLIDEKRGRIIALRNGIKTIGTIGVLLFAKQRGLITLVKPFIDILMKNSFRISEIFYHQILERTGEL
jgi:predicted nucleic acid-binding protein